MDKLRKLLFPFSWLYGGIVFLRNKFFDWNILTSKSYDIPIICVGNLSVGGTGKTPMIEYLIRLLQEHYKIATLSRGYKRKTSGYYLLKGNETAIETGDEPLQFKTKYSDIAVAVDENRQKGIAELKKISPKIDIILLDDAFQHRKVTPGFSVLLTSYDSIYAKDMMLPAGNLREPKSGAKRANIVVVTKCPPDIDHKEQEYIRQQLKLQPEQELYFSYIAYDNKVYSQTTALDWQDIPKEFALVTGIAKPEPLVSFLKTRGLEFKHYRFPDHHNFSDKDIEGLENESFILTTEKDFMRLKTTFSPKKLFYIPIKQEFIAGGKEFDSAVINWMNSFRIKNNFN